MSLTELGAGFLVRIEHDEPQRHLERGGIGHAALPAFVDVVFRRLEFVFDEFQHRSVGEVGNREYRFEDGLQALVGAAALRLHHQQELVVGCLLNLNEVRHLRDFLDFSEKLSYALPTDKRLRHHILSLNRTIGFERRRQSRHSNHRLDVRATDTREGICTRRSEAARRSRRLSRGPQSIATVGTGVARLVFPLVLPNSAQIRIRLNALPHA